MSAACRLLDAGYDVTLVERRPYLGGRAFSFTDPETGVQVDNGQHVFLGCCSYYIDFLKRLGTLSKTRLQKRMHVKVVDASGRPSALSSVPILPPPFHLLPGFLRYAHLGWGDKLRVMYALSIMRFADRRNAKLKGKSFYDWLAAHGQRQRAIDWFWDLVTRPTANDDSRHVSAQMGLMIFQEGLLKTRHGADIGLATVGLSEVMGDAAARYIQSRGGRLLLGRNIACLRMEDTRIAGVELAGGEVLRADWYVSAMPFFALKSILPDSLANEPFVAGLGKLESAPIVDLHVWYDRPVLDDEFVAVLGSPLQWAFNRTRIQGEDESQGQYVCISLSGAWEHIGQSKEALHGLCLREMARVFPKARDAKVTRFLVVKEERATFRPLPGSEAYRPSTATSVPNLFLAGEWTDTGWPSTMEGAVRSGDAAARAIEAKTRQR